MVGGKNIQIMSSLSVSWKWKVCIGCGVGEKSDYVFFECEVGVVSLYLVWWVSVSWKQSLFIWVWLVGKILRFIFFACELVVISGKVAPGSNHGTGVFSVVKLQCVVKVVLIKGLQLLNIVFVTKY